MAEQAEIDALVRGFSCPHEGIDAGVVELIAAEHATRSLEEFCGRYGDELAQGEGLVAALTPDANDGFPFEAAWDSSLGACKRVVVEGRHGDAVAAGAAAALRLTEMGRHGQWAASFPEPRTFHFGDHSFGDVRALEVEAADLHCRMLVNGTHTLLFDKPAERWTPRAGSCSLVPLFGPVRIVLPHSAPDIDPTAFGPIATADDIAELARAGVDALDLLAVHAPHYSAWVMHLLRKVVPLAPKPGQWNSGGDNYQWGLIYSSAMGDALPIAETVIHEITHQYLFLATRLGPIDDGTETRLFYSPVRGIPRPIEFIVIAYHAFANVYLFYDELARCGVEEARSREQLTTLLPQLRTLEEAIDATSALTSIGVALCQPLQRRLLDAR